MIPQPRLRVAYVVPDLGVGGAERHVTTLMSRLDRSHFEPLVLCIGRRGELFSALAAEGVPGVAFGRTKRQALRSLMDLVREFRKVSPDVVIVRGFNAELLGRVAAVLARVPHVIVWVHNCDDIEPRGVLRRLSDRVLDPMTDAYFGVARRQIPYLVDDLGYPQRKIRIIHNGVDPAQFDGAGEKGLRAQLGLAEQDLVVGILAALRPEKDHETFLHAARLVAMEIPKARFLIAGGGERRDVLETLAGQLGIADRVVFTGARDDVPALLKTIDVFVLSSFTVECFPMALLEAMASSRAAVCTAVGGVPEMIEDGVTGYLVPPRDPEALAGRLSSLLASPDQRRKFGDAGRARVESEFTLRRSVHETERQITDVAAPRKGRNGGPVRLAVVMDETFVGGVELLMLNVFRSFDPHVVEPRLICLRAAGPLAADFRAAGFDVEVMDRSGRFDLRTLPRLIKSLRMARTEAVLVTHHHRAALALGPLAARFAGSVNLIAAHDMDLTAIGKRCLPKWAVATLRGSSALVLLSPRQGAYLRREEGVGRHPWSRTREVVIPNGIALPQIPCAAAKARARSELGLHRDDFVVGIVARLTAQKAHHVLLEAFAILGRSHPHCRLVVVGGGERDGELRELAVRLGIEDRVMFTGIRRDVPTLLSAFDVSCLSSVHEGVPITVIESMAACLPVVATDCGSLRDLIADGEQGFIVPVGDSPALASRLATLADDRVMRGRQGRSARNKVERMYRIEQTAQGYESLLVDLVRVR